MKLNICRHCNCAFCATKVKPFCSGNCRRAHLAINNPINAFLVGASNENSNTSSNP